MPSHLQLAFILEPNSKAPEAGGEDFRPLISNGLTCSRTKCGCRFNEVTLQCAQAVRHAHTTRKRDGNKGCRCDCCKWLVRELPENKGWRPSHW